MQCTNIIMLNLLTSTVRASILCGETELYNYDILSYRCVMRDLGDFHGAVIFLWSLASAYWRWSLMR